MFNLNLLKRLRVFWLLLLTALFLGGLTYAAQLYYWAQKIPVTTSAWDSTFTLPWQSFTLRADSVVLLYKIGAPDNGSWASRPYMRMPVGGSFELGPSTKVTRLEVKAEAGSGNVYLEGLKAERQY